jgi:hypothetical protein
MMTACGTSEKQKEENFKLGVVVAECLLDNAAALDDGISPADTVAVGVISKCQSVIDAYDKVRLPSGAGINVYATTVWNNRHIGWMRQTTSIVLETRVSKKQKQTN